MKTADVTFQNLDSSEISLTDVSHYFDSDPTNLIKNLREDGKTPNRWSIIGSYYLHNYKGWHKFNETLNTRDSKGSRRRLPKAYLHRIWEEKEKRIELSKRDYNKFISEKLEKFNKQKQVHYNSQVHPILKSKDSDYERQLNHIINLETL